MTVGTQWIGNVPLVVVYLIGSTALAQLDDATATMAERLCKTRGNSTDIKVKLDGSASTGKVLAQLLGANGNISGSGEFTRSEWDGIRFTNLPDAYNRCLELVLPRIKKKRLIDIVGISGSLLRSSYVSNEDLGLDGCSRAEEDATSRAKPNCSTSWHVSLRQACVSAHDGPLWTFKRSITFECWE